MQNGMPYNWNELPFRSNFSWTQFPTLATNTFLLNYSNNTRPSNNTTTTVSLVNPPPFAGFDQSQGFLNMPNNNFAQQHQQQVMINAGNSIGTNHVYGSTNFMAGEINILESSMLVGHNPANANSTGNNGQAGQLVNNQGDLGNAAMQFLSPYKPSISNHMHTHPEQSNVEQLGVDNDEGSGAITNNGASKPNFNGGTQQGEAPQGTRPAVGQNDPRPQQVSSQLINTICIFVTDHILNADFIYMCSTVC